ncbi:DegT/DnrJ/EryC1/StrS family aminotransferase [Anaerobutyricum soehngenii]|uniref:DegT/DnrJ/EryC1/StrS family aminotransferase n=1 Tax=Anaerobutyricum soehngenii TaxID=105843 RepID=UPI001C0FA82F|nr:DegT/DnrJ/EryC1/StrS family aminotransferase [Anaerobutyricum soehngenii]MBU5416199.1 DegT/DnrJ/EryC1/StrS family aminotransferase [Anaerobutyricum soehngenii]
MFNKKNTYKKFDKKVWLASPTMHGPELKYVKEAYESNWMSTVGENINEIEKIAAENAKVKYAVGLSCCTAALHLCVKLAAEKLYGKPNISHGCLEGKRVFCSDMTFDATLNPVVYEGGIPIFIDTEVDSWNMDPVALEKAFDMYPDVELVVSAELYGFPGRMDEIKKICEKHGALLIEDAAEAMGATINGRQCGSFGDYSAISYNGNKIITGSSGGCLLTNSLEDANRTRKWATQARENAAWYQHEEVGYNYRMSNVVAGVVRGQYPYLKEHIAQKKKIFKRYVEGFRDLPLKMNPITEGTEPNYWLSAMIIEQEAMCKQVRGENDALYISEIGKSCPTEILEAISSINAEGRPIWKPMHMQPMYRMHEIVGREGTLRCRTNAYISGEVKDVGADIFNRGLCLPSDNKMTPEQQDRIIEVIRACFE